MHLDQLDGLVAFRCVSETKSFTAAASRLEVSTQAVSQAIKALESRLGVRLFHRTTRSVSLSEAGERFLALAAPALADLSEAMESVQEFRDKPVGLLRLGVSRPAFAAVIQPACAAFHDAYPDIRLEFSFDDGFVDIVGLGLDAGVRLGDDVAQDMVSIPLSRNEPLAIVASPAYLQRRGTPRSIGELAAHDCIRFRFPSTGAIFRWELLSDGLPIQLDVTGPVTLNDTAALLSCAVEGLGLAYVLERTADSLLKTGLLQKVLPEAMPLLPGFHLYHPSRRLTPPKLRCFIDFMKARVSGREGQI